MNDFLQCKDWGGTEAHKQMMRDSVQYKFGMSGDETFRMLCSTSHMLDAQPQRGKQNGN